MSMSSSIHSMRQLFGRCHGAATRLAAAWIAAAFTLVGLAACNNNPWPDGAAKTNTIFTGVIENSPRHLDPTASYWSNDTPYTYQIYEPPLQYHYLKRPFTLVPGTVSRMPVLRQYDKAGKLLPEGSDPAQVAVSEYELQIRPGSRLPHVAYLRGPPGAILAT